MAAVSVSKLQEQNGRDKNTDNTAHLCCYHAKDMEYGRGEKRSSVYIQPQIDPAKTEETPRPTTKHPHWLHWPGANRSTVCIVVQHPGTPIGTLSQYKIDIIIFFYIKLLNVTNSNRLCLNIARGGD